MATFEQREKDKLGLNPSLQNETISGSPYYYHLFGGRRFYFGVGNPVGILSASPGDVAFTDEGMFTCNGDGSGGAGNAWFSSGAAPKTAVLLANTELVVTHTLGFIVNVWAISSTGEVMDVEVYDNLITGFKVASVEAGTIYYR